MTLFNSSFLFAQRSHFSRTSTYIDSYVTDHDRRVITSVLLPGH